MRYGIGCLIVSCILLSVSIVLLILDSIVVSAILFSICMLLFFISLIIIHKNEQSIAMWRSRS